MSFRIIALIGAFAYLSRKDHVHALNLNHHAVPNQLWSPLIAQKVNATAFTVSSTQV
jgi:hypothetical protein